MKYNIYFDGILRIYYLEKDFWGVGWVNSEEVEREVRIMCKWDIWIEIEERWFGK